MNCVWKLDAMTRVKYCDDLRKVHFLARAVIGPARGLSMSAERPEGTSYQHLIKALYTPMRIFGSHGEEPQKALK